MFLLSDIYGLDNEANALKQYTEYMGSSGNSVSVFPSGLVVNPNMPWAGGTPDGKVLDSVYGAGLLEVKCPYSYRMVTPRNACAEPDFYCELINGKPYLKKEHIYFFQVQGQMGICGVDWCDFVVYTKKGLLIQRIVFDENFWEQMMSYLVKFYQEHIIPVAIKLS